MKICFNLMSSGERIALQHLGSAHCSALSGSAQRLAWYRHHGKTDHVRLPCGDAAHAVTIAPVRRAHPDAAMLTPGCAAALAASALDWLQAACLRPLGALLAAARDSGSERAPQGLESGPQALGGPGLEHVQRAAAGAAAAFAAALQLLTAGHGLPGVVRVPCVQMPVPNSCKMSYGQVRALSQKCYYIRPHRGRHGL